MNDYGLADCNNFFVSCERVFRPALEGRPAVVLSSNDGCIVARSDEAKALGVKMAQPAFQAKDLIERHSIAFISGNLQFYTDMSNRVMQAFPKPSLQRVHGTKVDIGSEDGAHDLGFFLVDRQGARVILRRLVAKRHSAPIHMPLEAAILSRMRSPVTSRSNCAKDKSTFSVRCPYPVAPYVANTRYDRSM